MEHVPYAGWNDNFRISNAHAELIVTLDVGPRILSYKRTGGKNVLKEFTSHLGHTGESDWMIRGGHRLWAAPEDPARTYAPDNAPVAVSVHDHPDGGSFARFTPPAEASHGIQKEFDVRLDPASTRVTVVHRIKNCGDRPTSLAPWALTVMAPGGVEVIPMPAYAPHPGHPSNAIGPESFAPTGRLILWPFTELSDPRFTFGARYLLLRQDAARGATKIGIGHALPWVAYANAETLFVKRFPFHPNAHYPDLGAAFETFTNEEMLEIESLGPLVELPPGAETEHVEEWELFPIEGSITDDETADRLVASLLQGYK